jgi:hypothetical protein
MVSVGLQAFFLCEVADVAARNDFLECVLLNDFDRLTYGGRKAPRESRARVADRIQALEVMALDA